MPKIVVKKDGREEEFIPEKIVVAAVKSGAKPEV
ncbi:MAG: ATPase, partial [Thermoplasmata archaeon]